MYKLKQIQIYKDRGRTNIFISDGLSKATYRLPDNINITAKYDGKEKPSCSQSFSHAMHKEHEMTLV